jgi:hypothetical protein
MGKIVISEIAKNGVKNARLVQYQEDEQSRKLMKEADERIRADLNNRANVYIKAASYIAR